MKVAVRGLDIHYIMDGPVDAPVVVFVHGLGASLGVWKRQAERLSSQFRVLRYDLRAHGGSSAPRQPCSRSDLAADLVGLLDALDIESAAVVGHSAGGVIAMQTAVDSPQRASALGLVGTASECNDRTAQWYERCADTALAEGGAAVMKAMGMREGSGPAPNGPGAAMMIQAMRTLNADPLTDAVRSITAPTLIVVGEKDFLGVGGSVILSRAIAGSRLQIVPDRGHGIYNEDADGFAALLGGFLAEHLSK